MSDDLHCGSSSSTLVNGRLVFGKRTGYLISHRLFLPTSSNKKKRSDGVRRSNYCRLDSDGRSDWDMYVPYICTQHYSASSLTLLSSIVLVDTLCPTTIFRPKNRRSPILHENRSISYHRNSFSRHSKLVHTTDSKDETTHHKTISFSIP